MSAQLRKVIFSGIQPTGIPHLGNYLGAMKPWRLLHKNLSPSSLMLISIVDLHALTSPPASALEMRLKVRQMATSLLASGLKPSANCIIFQQSAVPAHSELAWILSCFVTNNRLELLPQWRSKLEATPEGLTLGAFTYPMLMTADILLYNSNEIPVGDDQLAHLNLARELARTLNGRYQANLFPLPQPILQKTSGRIRSLRDPSVKMSKSDAKPRSRVELTDEPDVILDKIKKAVTDFNSKVTFDPETRPGVSNLVSIHSGITETEPSEICNSVSHLTTAEYKLHLAQILTRYFETFREEYHRLSKDGAYLDDIINEGNKRASLIANENLARVKQSLGLSQYVYNDFHK